MFDTALLYIFVTLIFPFLQYVNAEEGVIIYKESYNVRRDKRLLSEEEKQINKSIEIIDKPKYLLK